MKTITSTLQPSCPPATTLPLPVPHGPCAAVAPSARLELERAAVLWILDPRMGSTSLWKTVVCASPDGHSLVPGARASGADGRSPALPFPSPLFSPLILFLLPLLCRSSFSPRRGKREREEKEERRREREVTGRQERGRERGREREGGRERKRERERERGGSGAQHETRRTADQKKERQGAHGQNRRRESCHQRAVAGNKRAGSKRARPSPRASLLPRKHTQSGSLLLARGRAKQVLAQLTLGLGALVGPQLFVNAGEKRVRV